MPRWAWFAGAGALVVAGVGAAALLRGDDDLEKLAEAQRQSEKASSSSAQIRKSLQDIAENLDRAAGLSGASGRIEELTAAQRRSLRDLVDLLQGQLDTIERSSALVKQSTSSTAALARLSRAQSEELESAVDVLRRLRAFAAEAGGDSARLSQMARYGARLARDSRKAFER